MGATPTPARLGNYALIEELGRGGMGAVWRARDGVGREVALKILAPGWSEEDLLRFQREATLLAQLGHEGIVAVLDWGIDRGTPFLVMELIAGDSLERLIARNGPLPPRHAAEVARDMARAMAFAHERGVLHRDLKPGNVLLDAMGRARVVDFGLARRLSPEQESQVLTQTGVAMGTPATMAPEQARGERQLDGRTDVYGIGATLFWALTGRAPFQGRTWISCMRQAIEDPPPRPGSLQGGIDPRLEAICLRCLEKDPAARFQGARELATALGEWLRTARSGGTNRTPWLLLLGTGAATAAALVAILGGSPLPRAAPSPPRPVETSPHEPAPVVSATPSAPLTFPAMPGPDAEREARQARAQGLIDDPRDPLDAALGWLERARLASEQGQDDERSLCARQAALALNAAHEADPVRRARLQAWVQAVGGHWSEGLLGAIGGTAEEVLSRLDGLLDDCPPTASQLDEAIGRVARARLASVDAAEEGPLMVAQAALLAEAGRGDEAIGALAGRLNVELLAHKLIALDRGQAALTLAEALPSRDLQAAALMGLGRYKEAWPLLRPQVESLESTTDGETLRRIGICARHAGELELAVELLERCGDHFNRGGALASLGREREALEAYAEARTTFAVLRSAEIHLGAARLDDVERELLQLRGAQLSRCPEGRLHWIGLHLARRADDAAERELEVLRREAFDPRGERDAIGCYRKVPLYWAEGLWRSGRLEAARALLVQLRQERPLSAAEQEVLERSSGR